MVISPFPSVIDDQHQVGALSMQVAQDVMGTLKEAIVSVKETALPAPPKAPDDWLGASEVEVIQPDEEEKITQIGEILNMMQQHNFDAHQHHFRATHVKTQAIVRGELKVNDDLPEHLRQGVFAQPGATYPCIARYANEPSFLLPDTTRMPRGLGLKVFNVPGERLCANDTGKKTQDFTFNNSPQIELTDVTTCLDIFQLREKYFDSPTALQANLALRSDRIKQFAPAMLPNVHIVGAEMFSQSAFAFGPYVAHFSLVPATAEQSELGEQSIPSDASPTYHRDDLHDYYASREAVYTFRGQFCSDLSRQPVEDASVEWDERTAPWFDLATVTFPPQETLSNARRIWWEDKIALSPWEGLAAHKPLGSINRLRKRVYEMARGFRSRGNDVEVVSPKSADEMPE